MEQAEKKGVRMEILHKIIIKWNAMPQFLYNVFMESGKLTLKFIWKTALADVFSG